MICTIIDNPCKIFHSMCVDLHIFIFGNFEPEINNVAQKLKLNNEKLILDIGANFGVQSLQFAKAFSNSKILSIEPTDFAFSKMKKNFDLNDKFSKNLFPGFGFWVFKKIIFPGSGFLVY